MQKTKPLFIAAKLQKKKQIPKLLLQKAKQPIRFLCNFAAEK
jgi:hypothetical protein